MLNASGAVQQFELCEGKSPGAHALARIRVRGCGQLAVYCSQAALKVTLNGEAAASSFSTDRNILTVAVPQSKELLTDAVVEF